MFQRPAEPDIETEFVIIGSGPAGVTLGELLAKAGKEVWVLGSPYDSQLSKAGELEDTDLPDGTMGLNHIEDMVERMKQAGAKTKTSLVIKFYRSECLVVETKRQKFFAQKVILATGAKQVRLGFNGEEQFFHKGISDCSVCDFPIYRNKIVGVVGNHKYTSRAANFLAKHAKKVNLFWTDSNTPVVDDGISLYHVESIEATGDTSIKGVQIVSGNNSQTIQLDGLFVEGQPVPNTKFLLDTDVDLDENAYIIINDKFETSMQGVYAIGDVTGRSSNYMEAVASARELCNYLI